MRFEETRGERGFIKSEKWGDVVYGWSKQKTMIHDQQISC